MTARCTAYTGDRATVVLTPSRWGRLFGARPVTCELVGQDHWEGEVIWRHAATGRRVRGGEHGNLILRALDFREVDALPRAAVKRELVYP